MLCHSALDAESISSAFHTVVIARSVATWQSQLSSVRVLQLQSWNVSRTIQYRYAEFISASHIIVTQSLYQTLFGNAETVGSAKLIHMLCHSALDAESISSAFHTVVIARNEEAKQSHLSSVQVFQLQSWNVSRTQKLNPNKP